jgi:predicted pyridoxine 5'-phosphate oxidase superfamily flavin-nucleotide-binding protein
LNQDPFELPLTTARADRPGSDGEHWVQEELGTVARADRFYDEQVLDRLNPRMQEFVARQEMFFLSTADRHGECDSTFRAGPAGFLQVLDEKTLTYPEYRGNGVTASLGNIRENPHVGILLIDFFQDRIGLHVNGRARMVSDEAIRAIHPSLPVDPVPGRRPQVWVEVNVDEAYIHCSKHIPRFAKAPIRAKARDEVEGKGHSEQAWGTDDVKRKGGDYFGAAAEARTGARPVSGAREQAAGIPPRSRGRPAEGSDRGERLWHDGRARHARPAPDDDSAAFERLDSVLRAIRRVRALQTGEHDIQRGETEGPLDEVQPATESSPDSAQQDFRGWFS